MKKLIIIGLLIVSACDLLSTREPEIPNTGSTAFVTPTEPSILFENLENSFHDKVLENYMACFADPAFSDIIFKFVPAAGSISQFPDLVSWDLESERSYFNNLRTVPEEGIPITLTLSNEVNNPQGDSAIYQFDYSLSVPLGGESQTNLYKGGVLFRIYRDNRGQWVIGEWEDIQIEDYSSWSELKGFYY